MGNRDRQLLRIPRSAASASMSCVDDSVTPSSAFLSLFKLLKHSSSTSNNGRWNGGSTPPLTDSANGKFSFSIASCSNTTVSAHLVCLFSSSSFQFTQLATSVSKSPLSSNLTRTMTFPPLVSCAICLANPLRNGYKRLSVPSVRGAHNASPTRDVATSKKYRYERSNTSCEST